eukprot:jgi/Tetstr1/465888/TSEL_010505.t1
MLAASTASKKGSSSDGGGIMRLRKPVFNVIDSFASGVLGIISVGRTPYESFAELSEVLEFMGTELGTRGIETDSDVQGFKNIYSTFKYLADRLRPAARR